MERNYSIYIKFLFVLSIIGLLASPVILHVVDIPQKEQSIIICSRADSSLRILVTVEPSVTILSDADFASYSFSGDGSASSPFLIEDTTYPSIRISNISKHVTIRNCTVTSDGKAIRIGATAPNSIIVTNNTMVDEGNTRFDFDIGIFVSNSSGIVIKHNVIVGYDDGIDFNSSPNCLIVNNTISECENAGIRIENNAPFATISNNTIFDGDMAMHLENSNNLLVENNHCFDNYAGIILSSTSDVLSSSYCIVRYNLLENHQYYGAIVSGFFEQDFSGNNLLYLNTFVNNNPNGTSQAKDVGSNNLWYNEETRQGNYWSDWYGLRDYKIDGSAEAIDKHPLKNPYHTAIDSSLNYLVGRLIVTGIVFSSLLIIIGLAVLYQKRQKRKNIVEITEEEDTGIGNGETQ